MERLKKQMDSGNVKTQSVIYENWNPWHGCTKISPGCKYCYVYRQDERYGAETMSSLCRKTSGFDLPLKRKRDRSYKLSSGSVVFTCFTSDFLLKDADEWRAECWKMMKTRRDLYFYFFTKRIDRFAECAPSDWGDGYDNVLVGCTVENQAMVDYRLPIFKALPIKHKSIIAAPLLEKIDISSYLGDDIEEVNVSGESGNEARNLDYDWVLELRRQCVEKNVPFCFHQTGAFFIKGGKKYRIKRSEQIRQAKKAGIDFRICENNMPETADYKAAELNEQQKFDLTMN